MSDLVVSGIRTLVPLAVAWLVTTVGLDIDTAQATANLIGLLTVVWYGVARLLEQRWPAAGWLLGRPATPTYD